MAYVIGGGAPINGLPAEFGSIANTKILGLQIPVLLMIIGIIALAVVMKRTTYGMRVYAVGGNRNAAEIAGINAKNVLFSVYAFSGSAGRPLRRDAGLAGDLRPAEPRAGLRTRRHRRGGDRRRQPDGRPRHDLGNSAGLLIIQTLNNGLDILVVPAYWQDVIKGVLIVAAVAVDVWSTRRRA